MSTEPRRWQLGPEAQPSWWNFIRQLVMFAAGIFTILWVVVHPSHDVVLLITGMILVGLIPLENALVAIVKPRQTAERGLRIAEDQQGEARRTSEAGAGGDGPPLGGVRD